MPELTLLVLLIFTAIWQLQADRQRARTRRIQQAFVQLTADTHAFRDAMTSISTTAAEAEQRMAALGAALHDAAAHDHIIVWQTPHRWTPDPDPPAGVDLCVRCGGYGPLCGRHRAQVLACSEVQP